MPVIADHDRQHFEERGYLIVRDAVPPRNLATAVEAIWTFLGMDRDDPLDWYRPPATRWGGVEIYQHQALWDNRQHPRVYEAFRELLGREALWVSIDRAAMKPPAHPDHPDYDTAGFTHWDKDLGKLDDFTRPLPDYGVQGVLALTDTSENMGGFQCLPGFHRELPTWLEAQPRDDPAWKPDASGLPVRPIPMRAGDLLIWTTLLPHGNGRNTGERPRMAQYISMIPPRDDEALRQDRVRRWRERLPQAGTAFPGDPRRWEELHGETAELTPLGRKLLGLDFW